MLREHRRQEDEARDSLMRQIRDHRDQQDDFLMKMAMDLPRTFGMLVVALCPEFMSFLSLITFNLGSISIGR